eukprot:CAMPEP_0174353410 /NCGR_PEP_ID=MMETSP0811_2-20130205/14823_1 /TAXON_ID=73025 ORGANISM="Eutreptiella gymnastica-like, Strain CCMP1594" /NCGR_SAMPLE_ID=MMETSP0811_2 /ASSEMBLY_ACC=CAM_ASM_000667 /LENGTH=61 /DNA_ID=CAMNT_0015483883 /DNA_START=101 /DNA_END=283 /DNA_ORIENTATION=-
MPAASTTGKRAASKTIFDNWRRCFTPCGFYKHTSNARKPSTTKVAKPWVNDQFAKIANDKS